MKNKKIFSTIKKELDLFLKLARSIAKSHPYIVIIVMHEYFRTIYPNDPFISETYDSDSAKNILKCLRNNNKIMLSFKNTGSYFRNSSSIRKYLGSFENEKKLKTQDLFGKLWNERMKSNYLNSRKVLIDSFKKNNFDYKFFKNKKILDMGCGSGRFTLALASLGAKKVIGVDLGAEGIEVAKKTAKLNHIKNVKFVEGSVLNLPFKNEEFDFVFCKGVLHHTGNLEKGLSEYYRVMKKSGMGFLYLYGSGGIFWNSRKKMRKVMKLIPLEYTIKVLDLIGMPSRRTIFVDSWYVPIEDHCKSNKIEKSLKKLKFNNIHRWKKGRKIELETVVFSKSIDSNELWGEGELRYIVKK